MNSFYVIAKGHNTGVFSSWNECKHLIDNFDNPIFKKFDNYNDAIDFLNDFKNNIYVYTDGACINNGSKDAKAGIGVYFSKDNPNNISKEIFNKNGHLTNNFAELTAIIEAINIIKNYDKPNKIIITDSEYAIKCATTYGNKLEKKEWKSKKNKIIPNLELIKILYQLTNQFNIKFQHILAHTDKKDKHSIGNYYADLLANNSINLTPNIHKSITPRIYLKVPYANKDDAKIKGAKWDATKKSWYIFEDNPNKSYLFEKYKN